VAGFHSQALDTLQEKLSDAEASLRLEVEQHRKTQVDVLTYLPAVFSLKLASNLLYSLESCLMVSFGTHLLRPCAFTDFDHSFKISKTRCSQRWQTCPLLPPPGELDETYTSFK